jgi:hypothetical protein
VSTVEVEVEGTWWPPGDGEPGCEWSPDLCRLRLQHDGGEVIDVLQVTQGGDRALVAVPIAGLAVVLARRFEHG